MRIAARMLLLSAALAGAAWAQPARAPSLAVFRSFDAGLWELREPRSTRIARRLCVSDPMVLMQLRHGGAPCSRYVIDDQPVLATLHYTCPGAGHGRTTLKVETRELIQLESQGIAANAPFNVRYEGRRRGACNSTVKPAFTNPD